MLPHIVRPYLGFSTEKAAGTNRWNEPTSPQPAAIKYAFAVTSKTAGQLISTA